MARGSSFLWAAGWVSRGFTQATLARLRRASAKTGRPNGFSHHDGQAFGGVLGAAQRGERAGAAAVGGADVDEQDLVFGLVDDLLQRGAQLDELARGELAAEHGALP